MRYRVVLLIAALAAALSLALPAVAGAGTRYITGTVLTNGGASAHNANCYLYQQLPGGTWNYVAVRSTGSGDQCVFGQWADNYFYKVYAFKQICPGNTWWSDYVNTMVNGSWVTHALRRGLPRGFSARGAPSGAPYPFPRSACTR